MRCLKMSLKLLMEPEDRGRFLGGHLLHFFFFFSLVKQHTSNMELYKLQTVHSLTFYIELSSKFVGVGLNVTPDVFV